MGLSQFSINKKYEREVIGDETIIRTSLDGKRHETKVYKQHVFNDSKEELLVKHIMFGGSDDETIMVSTSYNDKGQKESEKIEYIEEGKRIEEIIKFEYNDNNLISEENLVRWEDHIEKEKMRKIIDYVFDENNNIVEENWFITNIEHASYYI